MDKSPAFQFYPADWLGSTKVTLMTLEQQGAYIRLLCHAWSDPGCALEDDDENLAKLSGLGDRWKGASDLVKRCFTKKGTTLISERLLKERKKQNEWKEKSKRGGMKSGESRRNKDLQPKGGSDMVPTKDEPKGNTSSSFSSTPSPLKKRTSEPSPEALRLAGLLADKILIHSPKYRYLQDKKRDATINRWAISIKHMMNIDNRPPEGIEKIITWSTTHTFWKSNILSGDKLRNQYDTLVLQYKAEKEKQGAKVNAATFDDTKRRIHDMQEEYNRLKSDYDAGHYFGESKVRAEAKMENLLKDIQTLKKRLGG